MTNKPWLALNGRMAASHRARHPPAVVSVSPYQSQERIMSWQAVSRRMAASHRALLSRHFQGVGCSGRLRIFSLQSPRLLRCEAVSSLPPATNVQCFLYLKRNIEIKEMSSQAVHGRHTEFPMENRCHIHMEKFHEHRSRKRFSVENW
jgi:hypothetical protein